METKPCWNTKERLKQFEAWYNTYDFKKARLVAERAWLKVDPNLYEIIMDHTEKFVQVTYKDGTFPSRPYPATYLNQMRWEDEIVANSEDAFMMKMRKQYGG